MIFKLVTGMGMLLSSLAVTVFIILVLEQTLPDFLVQILLGTNEDSYPITFQTVMWLPFGLGMVVLAQRILQYLENIRQYKKTESNFDLMAIQSISDLDRVLDSFQGLKKLFTKNIFLHLYLSGLETLHYSTRYNDIKGEIETASSIIQSEIDSTYSKIKYIAWLLPTLGFMGTVYGISISVANFGTMSPDSPDLFSEIAGTLAVAFNTTLLSLIQSAIIVMFVTFLENMENDFVSFCVVRTQKTLRRFIRKIDSKKFISRSA